jgi:hypothetical protein
VDVKGEKLFTPLQPKDFFRGVWTGQGELIPHPLLRWFVRKETVQYRSEAVWLSESIWIVKDCFEFSLGRVVEGRMFAELVAPDRIHVTADHMPGGADILLSERAFRFTPYYALASYGGKIWRFRCLDECLVDANGFVHDTIRMFFWGVPVATMRLGPTKRSGDSAGSTEPETRYLLEKPSL